MNELSALEMVVTCLAVTLGYTVFGMTGFGASAPYKALYRHFGITPEAVVKAAKERV